MFSLSLEFVFVDLGHDPFPSGDLRWVICFKIDFDRFLRYMCFGSQFSIFFIMFVYLHLWYEVYCSEFP